MEEDANQYALILEDRNGNCVQIPGTEMLKLKEHGILKLYSATYRLMFDNQNQGI
jgi:hypothetical protein